MITSNWDNDEIQFVRLLAEMNACVSFDPGSMHRLTESMDLTEDEIYQILERTETRFEAIKQQLITGPVSEEQELCTELELWCKRQGLKWESADELLLRDDLSLYQRRYLHYFGERWELAMSDQP